MNSFQVEGPLHLEVLPEKQCLTYLAVDKSPAFLYYSLTLSTPSTILVLGEKQECTGTLLLLVRRSDDKTILSQKPLHFEGFTEKIVIDTTHIPIDIGLFCHDCEHKDTFDLLSFKVEDYVPHLEQPKPILPTVKPTPQIQDLTIALAQRLKKQNRDDVSMKSIRVYKNLQVDIPTHTLETPDSQPMEPTPTEQYNTPPHEEKTLVRIVIEKPTPLPSSPLPENQVAVIVEEPIVVVAVVASQPEEAIVMKKEGVSLMSSERVEEFQSRFSMKIGQLYTSKALVVFGKRLLQRYSLEEYKNPNVPAFFYGCCTPQDYITISQHNGLGVIIWSGPDIMLVARNLSFVNFLKKAKNIYHIATSSSIENDLKILELSYLYLPVTPILSDHIFSPTKKGNAVYVYSQPAIPSFYKMDQIKKIQEKLPDTTFIFSIPPNPTLTQPVLKNDVISAPYSAMPSFYENCFVGLRLTENDGVSCSVQEMALMGRKTIHNDRTPGCITYTDEDSIIQAIISEKKTVGSVDERVAKDTLKMIQEVDLYLPHILSPITVLNRQFKRKFDGSSPNEYKWENVIGPTTFLILRRTKEQWIMELYDQIHAPRQIAYIDSVDILPPASQKWILTSLP